ncbi:MAG: carboxypeptidase-like regulatory domain-containing protein [Bacteroidetes bacterium]|nr:carboxypeptidase-like regulatory domain-containing protein [Bacteroidota bacterium]
MKIKFLSVLLLFALSISQAQVKPRCLSGKVVNQNNEKLAYASIQFKGSNNGAITNEDGEFLIHREKLVSDTLVVYFMGYISREIAIDETNDRLTITLEKAVHTLKEVVVLADQESYAYGLLTKLIKKYRGKTENLSSKAYLSIYSKMNQPLEIFEAFYNAELNPRDGITSLELKNGRAGLIKKDNFAFVSLNTTDILSDFSPFLKVMNQKLPIGPTNLNNSAIKSKYHLEIEDLLNDGDEHTAVIAFNPKINNGLYFSGKIYINIGRNELQKLTLEIKNTKQDFLKSIQENTLVDSLNIKLELNYEQNSTRLQSMIYDYDFILSSQPQNRIVSRALLAFYDYGSPFEMPLSEPVNLGFDYQRILSYPFNKHFWEANYYLPISQNKTDFTNFFKTRGYLINHDSISVQSPYIESPYLNWSTTNRLIWSDIPNKKPILPQGDESGVLVIAYQTAGNSYLRGHLFLDYEVEGPNTYYYSRASIDRDLSFFKDMRRDVYTLVYLNIYFDLYEVHRRMLMDKLNSLGSAKRKEIANIYQEELKLLHNELQSMRKETQQGFNVEGLSNWNFYIKKKLGVNNFKIFGVEEDPGKP